MFALKLGRFANYAISCCGLFYIITFLYLASLLLAVPLYMVFNVEAGFVSAVLNIRIPADTLYVAVAIAFLLIYISCFLLTFRDLTTNLFISSVRLADGSRMESDATSLGIWFKITLPNFLLTTLSLGLLYPWAKVRRWRHMVSSAYLVPTQALRDSLSGDSGLSSYFSKGTSNAVDR